MSTDSKITFNKDKYAAHLSSQFECLWKHLEYQDTYVIKLLSIYFAFSGLFVAKINLFKGNAVPASILIALVSIVFSILLYRISSLLTELKTNIRQIDMEMHSIHGGKFIHSVPGSYVDSKLRTSKISTLAIILFAIASIAYMCYT